jgi:hypothetical protein
VNTQPITPPTFRVALKITFCLRPVVHVVSVFAAMRQVKVLGATRHDAVGDGLRGNGPCTPELCVDLALLSLKAPIRRSSMTRRCLEVPH